MAVEIKSGTSSDLATIDAISKAIRVTQYDSAGVEIVPSLPISIEVSNVTVANNDLIASFDASAYKFISVQLTGTWGGSVQFQGSNDNGTFVPLTVQDMGVILSPYVLSATSNAIITVPISMKFLRVRVIAFTSGIIQGVAFGYKELNTNGQISAVGSVTLAAETTKAIGVVRLADGAGNLLETTEAGTGQKNLNVIPAGQVYHFSTANSSSAQLASGASFVGAVESIVSQQAFIILAFSDKDGVITIEQFSDELGTKVNQTLAYAVSANVGFARSGVINGNYIRVTFLNSGSLTALFELDTAFGTIPAATQLNNSPSALMEILGTVVATGGGVRGAGVQRVSIATDDLVPVSFGALPAGSNVIGSVRSLPASADALIPLFILGNQGAVNVNSVSIRNVPAILRTVVFTNYTATARHLKLYDTASVPTAGNGTPVIVCSLPASGTLVYPLPVEGFAFSNGIGATMTLGAANNDVTPTATSPDFSVSLIST
jgi:hypothetical protein